jgi:hypothetical protein
MWNKFQWFIILNLLWYAKPNLVAQGDTTLMDKWNKKIVFSGFSPAVGYNDNDGFMAGLSYLYENENNAGLQFQIVSFYGFGSQGVNGQSSIAYKTPSKKYSFRAGIKSYHKNHNDNYNYHERYMRFDPSVTYHFKDLEKNRKLKMTIFITNDEEAQFDPTYIGKRNDIYLIPRLEYSTKNLGAVSEKILDASIEAMRYESFGDQAYVKATASYFRRWFYKPKKGFDLRLFGSGFLINSQRRSTSYQNIFTRGSIALILQGFNDYTYDEIFLSRENQNRFFDNQVSQNKGGGFKTAIGSSYSFGMSNNFALAVNTSIDAPIKWLPIAAYFDIGIFSVPTSTDDWNNISIYNGGVKLKMKIVDIYFPIFSSKNLSDISKSQHENFFHSISFGLNLENIRLGVLNLKNYN